MADDAPTQIGPPAGSRRPLVVQTEPLDPEAVAWLAERCDVERCAPGEPRFGDLLLRADALVVRTYTRVDAALLDRSPRLRVVGRAGVGVDNIDLAACRARGVAVVNTPAANTRAVVEFVLAVMLDALRPRTSVAAPMDAGAWRAMRQSLIAPRQLAGLTLGVYGLGRIGSQVARAGAALDMRVLYHDLLDLPPAARSGAEPVTRERLLADSDVLTVHVDGRPSNRHLLDARAFALLKPEALFINAARGFVVDAAALAAFLRSHPGAAAVLDVHEPEPFGPDYPLLGLANARLTPHIAAATAPAHRAMSWVVRDVWRILCGQTPEWPALDDR